jgi:inosine/xanthosine triphosphatase
VKIVVGSHNPVKIEATRQAFALHFGADTELEIIPAKAPSGVADQPMDINETATGAYNRARFLTQQYPDMDYYIGIEGGLSHTTISSETYAFEQTWAAVIAKDGTHAIGSGPAYPIDQTIIDHLEAGANLTDAMAKEHGTVDLGKNDGYNGWLSNNNYDRTEASKIAVFLALSKLHK